MAFLKYNEFELLELFESEPNIVFEPENEVVIYSKTDYRNVTLTMLISVYENQCQMELKTLFEGEYIPIFDIDTRDVIMIKGDNEKLIIHRASKRNIEIRFKPSFMFTFESI